MLYYKSFVIAKMLHLIILLYGRLSGVDRHGRHLSEAHLPELGHKGFDLALKIIGHESKRGCLDELLQLRDTCGARRWGPKLTTTWHPQITSPLQEATPPRGATRCLAQRRA